MSINIESLQKLELSAMGLVRVREYNSEEGFIKLSFREEVGKDTQSQKIVTKFNPPLVYGNRFLYSFDSETQRYVDEMNYSAWLFYSDRKGKLFDSKYTLGLYSPYAFWIEARLWNEYQKEEQLYIRRLGDSEFSKIGGNSMQVPPYTQRQLQQDFNFTVSLALHLIGIAQDKKDK